MTVYPPRRRASMNGYFPRLAALLCAAAILPCLRAGDGAAHWAFVAPQRPTIPAVRDAQAIRNPIDGFVQASLEQRGLTMSATAERATLLRRVSLDLTGLPPSLAEI